MGLKAFHVFFIVAATLLCLGFGVWSIRAYAGSGRSGLLVSGLVSLAAGAGLPGYGVWFLRKLKGVSYL
jgi:hypothetical protein